MTQTNTATDIKGPSASVKQAQKNRGGAPIKKVKRNSGIRVRLTVAERFLIESKAKHAGMRLSGWFRAAALKAQVVTRITAEDRRTLHLLAGMANNLNQLTKLAHTSGIMGLAIRCGNLLDEIDRTLRYLNSDDGKGY